MGCPNGNDLCIRQGKHSTCSIDPMKDTGAVKHDNNKYDPTYMSVEFLELYSRVRMFGAQKYARNNWKKGFKITRSLASGLRHVFAFLSGEDNDPESGLCHLGHAVCCIEHAYWDYIKHKHNDDRNE